jgi:hypothetical protein
MAKKVVPNVDMNVVEKNGGRDMEKLVVDFGVAK